MKRLVFLALMLCAPPVMAQHGDPMELQRCIWRCLANSPGAHSPIYHQCVSRLCSEPQYVPQTAAPVAQGWAAGMAADGQTWSAGLAAPDGSGQGLYYQCVPGRGGYLMLYGLKAREGVFQISIDGRAYPLAFHNRRGELTSDLPPSAPFLNLLGQGRAIAIVDPDGAYRAGYSLLNAQGAIWQVRAACGG
ncbi:hypothetical protein Q5Y75_03735 [Ruegeria sp. 2205SS24-7]|uniref:hypothetical protein n=1 Tax=Ruegeria discodermiae TaxID=3064389 RepID=UPI0027428A89|nr:hypothetical protein [Ruegeria sp. 2205SS24-7]MDP5216319.1 hypothetical protein [Ruegeria sp. 2205SS24-7]